MEYKTIGYFDGGYSRRGTIDLGEGKCDVCGKEDKCIMIDGSEGEYAEGRICKSCIDKAFNGE